MKIAINSLAFVYVFCAHRKYLKIFFSLVFFFGDKARKTPSGQINKNDTQSDFSFTSYCHSYPVAWMGRWCQTCEFRMLLILRYWTFFSCSLCVCKRTQIKNTSKNVNVPHRERIPNDTSDFGIGWFDSLNKLRLTISFHIFAADPHRYDNYNCMTFSFLFLAVSSPTIQCFLNACLDARTCTHWTNQRTWKKKLSQSTFHACRWTL